MTTLTWSGVMPAITTPFDTDGRIDLDFLAEHAAWLVDHGATAIIPLGSLGEGATLTFEEKQFSVKMLVDAVGDRVPIVPAVSALSTREAVNIARMAKVIGCSGLMVLPPYVHKGPWAEYEAHFDAVFQACDLPCMLYNNPIAYGVDVTPERIEAFADRHENLQAVKESSGDARRVTAVKARLRDRLAIFAGLDDMIVEAVAMGATGWVAGLVNALPAESMKLFRLAQEGRMEEAMKLYRWFLPLLRLDTLPEFVQCIKLVQQTVGRGSEAVRLPRLPLTGELREHTLRVLETAGLGL